MLTYSKFPFKILTPLKSSKSHLNAKFYQHPPFRRSKAVSNLKLVTNIATKASAVTESHSTSTSSSSSRSTSSSHNHKLKSAPSKRLMSTVGKVFIVLAGVIFVASLSMNAAFSYFQLYFNVSESLPYGLYKITYIHKPGLNPFAFSDNRDAIQDASAVAATDSSDTAATDGYDIAALADSSDMGESAMAERDAKRGSHFSFERGMLVLACLPDEVAKLAYERNYIASGKCKGGYAPVGKYIQAISGDEVRFTSDGIIVNGSLLENSKPYAMDGEGRPMPVMLQDMVLPKDELVLLNNYAGSFDSRYYGPIPSRYVVGTLKPIWTF